MQYLIDEAGDTDDGALDIPQAVQRRLNIPLTGRTRWFKMANGRTSTYSLVDVHVEYTQPNGDKRAAVFSASVLPNDLGGDLPLFGNQAKLGLRLTTGPAIPF